MKDKLIAPLLKLALPTAVRHLLAAIAGWLAVSPGATLFEYVLAGLVMLITWLWSLFERGDQIPDKKAVIANLARALASQAVAFLSGMLAEHGYAGDANDPYGVLVWTANYAHSLSVKRKANAEPLQGRAVSERPEGVDAEG